MSNLNCHRPEDAAGAGASRSAARRTREFKKHLLHPALALIALLAALLASDAATAQPRSPQQRRRAGATAAGRAIPPDVLLRIVRAEDERRWDDVDLGALLNDANPNVRRRAALAAGRIGDEAGVAPLALLLLKDVNEAVRATAAFALGETESENGVNALLQTLRTNAPMEVRARSIEALGKLAAALPERRAERKKEIGAAILLALDVEGKLSKPDRGVVMMGLTAVLRARPEAASQTVARFLASPDARVRADAANTLARLRASDVNETLRPLLTNDFDPVVRANVARALGAAEDKESFDALLARSLTDADERVRVSSIRSLASLKDARAAAPLLARGDTLLAAFRDAKAKGSANPAEQNELLEIASALGRVAANTNEARAVTFLRAAREALELGAPEIEIAFARVAPAQYVREIPFGNVSGRDGGGGAGQNPVASGRSWQSASSAAQGLGEIAQMTSAAGGNSAVSLQVDAQMLVRALLSDPQTPALALPDVLNALAAFKPPDQGELMRAQLTSRDVLVRATAAGHLAELAPDPANVRALADALPRALEDESNDAALATLDALAKIKGNEATAAIRSVLGVPDHLVRRRAAALLRDGIVSGEAPRVETVATRNKPADYARALGRVGRRVFAHVSTDKGQFTIELLPEDAPLNVDNFVELARRGYFNNVTFHRVVSNFVVQGGDPRGDGNGGPGYQIRCEINQVPYARGAVGMALSGKDTGGSQWFVTHAPQPSLDGGYTVFGRVVEGMETVDRIARGDRIRAVRVTEAKAVAARRR